MSIFSETWGEEKGTQTVKTEHFQYGKKKILST